MTVSHLIVTRHLVGINRPETFARHSRILLATLFPSIVSQTSKNFHWVVVTDSLIDDATNALLCSAFEDFRNFHLERIDPFDKFSMSVSSMITVLAEKYLGTTENVVTTRIDDDDALSSDFVEMAQAAVSNELSLGAGPFSFSFDSGIAYNAANNTFGPVSSPGTSAGMSAFSPSVERFNAHSANHRKMHAAVQRFGGRQIILDSSTPRYFKGLFPTSDSRESKDSERVGKKFKSVPKNQKEFEEAMAIFGIPSGHSGRIRQILANFNDPRPPLLPPPAGRRPLRRLPLKAKYLNMAKELWPALESENLSTRERAAEQILLLKQAFYLV